MRVRALRDFFGPLLLYVAMFVALTWPRILDFGRVFFGDEGDGLANVWNLWWVERALRLGEPLWSTEHLHFPHGTTLAGHTLALLDTLLAIPLGRALGPVGAYDALVLFAFVGSALSSYWLALDVTGRRGPSLAGGALFGFSSYMFAHAEGHLNLITLQALPLYVLALGKLLERPGPARALLAGGAFGLVGLSELSYVFYAAIATALVVAARAWAAGWRTLVEPARARALGLFALAAGALTAPLALPLWWLRRSDKLVGVHDSADHSLDALSLLVPGGHWLFASATEPFWSRLAANPHETSVHLGLGVLGLVAVAWRRRRELPGSGAWFALFFGALVLALGPRLHVAGWELPVLRLPYKLLEGISSTVRISGMPIRIVVLVTLAAAVLSAHALARLLEEGRRGRVLAAALLALALVEHLPAPLPATSPAVPAWVEALRDLPDGAAIDEVSRGGRHLYHQTVHGKRLAFGHLARLPRAVVAADEPLRRALDAGDGPALARAGFRWLVLPPARAWPGEVVFADGSARIVRLTPER